MKLFRRFLYGLGESLRGWNTLERIDDLREMERWPRDRLEAWQLERLQQVVGHAYGHVPFYRRLWDDAGVHPEQIKQISDLATFPKTSKQQMMAAGDDVRDLAQPAGSVLEMRSSGSTGKRFVYYESKAHYSWSVASRLHSWTLAGWDLGEPWVRVQFRGNLSRRQKLEDRFFNCLYMPIDRLDEEFMSGFADRAARFRPVLVRGYPGGTYVFARFLLERGDTRIRPRAVCTAGDTLYPHYREAIAEAFDCPIFDFYGGEGMATAGQCEAGTYHVYPPVLVELEPTGQVGEDGPLGRILLTSLTNLAMPMVRYDIADVAVAAEGECSCGRHWPTLKRIVGRETDIVVTPAGRHLVCHHFNNVMRKQDGVDQFQVRQEAREGITILLETNERYDRDRDEPAIAGGLRELGGEGFDVRVQYVDEIPMPPTGKRRYIISEVGPGLRGA